MSLLAGPVADVVTSPVPAVRPIRVVILTASVGGGHVVPAAELARRLTRRGARVDVIDLVALCPAGCGHALRSAFRALLKGAPQVWGRVYRATDSASRRGTPIRLLMGLVTGRIAGLLSGPAGCEPADVMVSTYPFGAHLAYAARRLGGPEIPVVTYVTDPGVHGLWIAPGTRRYLTGWPAATDALRRLGAGDVVTVDPLVRECFHPARFAGTRAAERAAWGLPPGSLALVMSGSWGVGDMAGTARDLMRLPGVTPVVVCGRNRRLRRSLAGLPGAVVLGWVDEVASLMRACDVAVLNSGGSSLAEAQACGLPVIHYRALAGQGAANAAAHRSMGSFWARDTGEFAAAVRYALHHGASTPVSRADAADQVLLAARRPATTEIAQPGWRARSRVLATMRSAPGIRR